MLRIENLTKVYPNGTQALTDVSFEVADGEFCGDRLSGSGKSTLLRCINRLVEPTSGKIFMDDVEVTARQGRRDPAHPPPDRDDLPAVQPGETLLGDDQRDDRAPGLCRTPSPACWGSILAEDRQAGRCQPGTGGPAGKSCTCAPTRSPAGSSSAWASPGP